MTTEKVFGPFTYAPSVLTTNVVVALGKSGTAEGKDQYGKPKPLPWVVLELQEKPVEGSIPTSRVFRKAMNDSETPAGYKYVMDKGEAIKGCKVDTYNTDVLCDFPYYIMLPKTDKDGNPLPKDKDGNRQLVRALDNQGQPRTSTRIPIRKWSGLGPVNNADVLREIVKIESQRKYGGGFLKEFDVESVKNGSYVDTSSKKSDTPEEDGGPF